MYKFSKIKPPFIEFQKFDIDFNKLKKAYKSSGIINSTLSIEGDDSETIIS